MIETRRGQDKMSSRRSNARKHADADPRQQLVNMIAYEIIKIRVGGAVYGSREV